MGNGATSPRGSWLFQLGHQPLAEDGLQPRAGLCAGTRGRRASLAVPFPMLSLRPPIHPFQASRRPLAFLTGTRRPVVLGPVVFSSFWLYLSASGSKQGGFMERLLTLRLCHPAFLFLGWLTQTLTLTSHT